MSKTVTVELPETLYEVLQQKAAAAQATPGAIILACLAEHLTPGEASSAAGSDGTASQVSPVIREVLEQVALQTGRPLPETIRAWKERYGAKPRPPRTEAERQAARASLLRFSGAVRSGDSHSGDNERIDADLAREYLETHEPEA